MPRDDWINEFLVDGPDFVPFLESDVLRSALRENVFLQSIECESPAQHPLDCRKTGVSPSLHPSCVDKPLKLPLRQNSVDQVQPAQTPVTRVKNTLQKSSITPRELYDFHIRERGVYCLNLFQNPVVLCLPVQVTDGAVSGKVWWRVTCLCIHCFAWRVSLPLENPQTDRQSHK